MTERFRRFLRDLPVLIALGGLYFLAGKWGLTLASVQANATAVWPPTGIALAAFLLLGNRVWPAVFWGAFFVNLTTSGTVATSAGIALGNTLEALAGCAMVNRFADGKSALQNSRNIPAFVAAGGLLAPLVSATVGVGTLTLGGLVHGDKLKAVWLTWWLGDVTGALLVAPILLLGAGYRWPRMTPAKILESAGFFFLLFFISWLEFGGQSFLSVHNFPLQFLFIPLMIWPAVRFGPFETATATFVLSISAIWGTLHGFGPFHGDSDNQSLLFLQTFMGVLGVTVLSLSVIVSERRQAEERLQKSHSYLERGLAESTENFRLLSEATREGVALSEEGKIMDANQAFYRMFGYEPWEVKGKEAVAFVDPKDRETVREHIFSGDEKTYEVTGLKKSGEKMLLEITGKIIRQDGRVTRMAAIRDITEQRQREEEIREKTTDLELLKAVAVASNQAVDPEEALLTCLGEICRMTGWPVGHVYLLSEEAPPVMRSTKLWYMQDPPRYETFRRITEETAFRSGEGLPGRILASGLPLCVPDVTRDSNFPRARKAKDIGVKGSFGFPVLVGDKVAAVLEFFSSEPAQVDPSFLELMGNVGAQLGRVMERRLAARALENSEKHFRDMIENSLDIVTLMAPDGVIQYESPSSQRILGFAPSERLGQNAFSFIHPDDLPEVQKRFAEVLEKPGNIRSAEFRHRHRDGSWKTLESIGANLQEDPAFKGVVVNSRDITLRRETEKKLHESESKFRSVVQTSGDAIVIMDSEANILSWNLGAESILGYAEKEVLGMPLSLALAIRFKEPLQKELNRLAQAGLDQLGGRSFEWEGIRKDGSVFPVEISLSTWAQGEERFFGGNIRDITERKQVDELSRSNQELEQFAYVTSHDLQEPLRMVASYVQLLQRRYQDKLDAEANLFIEQAVDGAKRMQTLINDLLSYSRLGTQAKPFEMISCEQALESALFNLGTRIQESGARVSHDPLPEIWGDINQMVQLFQNLIGNAIKFHGALPPEIHIGVEKGERDWTFQVRDNGIGIDGKYASRIFEVFKRLHSRSEYPGTGIGLAICKKVVNRHGGRIWVESQEGKGATFFWTLPLRKGAANEPAKSR
ncbi:MAG TPA: PAS domain S-box protein [bacterium]|nr:PAS domain S-box protein [bacterium]